MKKQWWHNAVIYQIYPKSFYDSNNDGIGDIKGIIKKLPLIKNNIDIDALWVCPFYKSPMKDNGYDVSDYYNVDQIFGKDDDIIQLISLCNKMKIKLIIDVVLNHTSDQHEWFKKALSGEKKYIKYYNFYKKIPNNWQSIFGGSAWTFCKELDMYYLHMFDKSQPDLNWDNPELIREVSKILNFWIKKGVSGFRLDVIGMIGKDISKSEIYTKKVHERLSSLRKITWKKDSFLTVGETGGDFNMAINFTNPKTKQLSQTFTYDHMNIDDGKLGKWTTKKFQLKKLAAIHKDWQQKINIENGWLTNYLENHDQPRIVSRWGNSSYLRYYSSCVFATILLISKGTSYIFQGQEIGMTNFKAKSINEYDDVEVYNTYLNDVLNLKKISKKEFLRSCNIRSRDNARTTYQWDSSKNGGFSNQKPWFKTNENHKEINLLKDLKSEFSIVKNFDRLIKLRKKLEEFLVYGNYKQEFLSNEILVYSYELKSRKIKVYLNFSEKQKKIKIEGKIIYNNYQEISKNLMPWQAVVAEV